MSQNTVTFVGEPNPNGMALLSSASSSFIYDSNLMVACCPDNYVLCTINPSNNEMTGCYTLINNDEQESCRICGVVF